MDLPLITTYTCKFATVQKRCITFSELTEGPGLKLTGIVIFLIVAVCCFNTLYNLRVNLGKSFENKDVSLCELKIYRPPTPKFSEKVARQ